MVTAPLPRWCPVSSVQADSLAILGALLTSSNGLGQDMAAPVAHLHPPTEHQMLELAPCSIPIPPTTLLPSATASAVYHMALPACSEHMTSATLAAQQDQDTLITDTDLTPHDIDTLLQWALESAQDDLPCETQQCAQP